MKNVTAVKTCFRNPPSDVTVMFLNEGHAKEINEKWSQKFLDSENVIKDCILTSFGMGEYGFVNV